MYRAFAFFGYLLIGVQVVEGLDLKTLNNNLVKIVKMKS